MTQYEWRVVAEANMVGAEWESEWEPYTGTQTTPERITEELLGEHPSGAALDAACEAAGFGYAVQIREIGDEG